MSSWNEVFKALIEDRSFIVKSFLIWLLVPGIISILGVLYGGIMGAVFFLLLVYFSAFFSASIAYTFFWISVVGVTIFLMRRAYRAQSWSSLIVAHCASALLTVGPLYQVLFVIPWANRGSMF